MKLMVRTAKLLKNMLAEDIKKYDANGKIIEYTPKVDDESINDDIDEPDDVFYKLYPWERKKLEEGEM